MAVSVGERSQAIIFAAGREISTARKRLRLKNQLAFSVPSKPRRKAQISSRFSVRVRLGRTVLRCAPIMVSGSGAVLACRRRARPEPSPYSGIAVSGLKQCSLTGGRKRAMLCRGAPIR
jgi:hypothetical protein